MAQPDISPGSENTLLGQLHIPRDMPYSYKAFLYEDEPPPNTFQRHLYPSHYKTSTSEN